MCTSYDMCIYFGVKCSNACVFVFVYNIGIDSGGAVDENSFCVAQCLQ